MSDCLKDAYNLLVGNSNEFASKNFLENTESKEITYEEFLEAINPLCEELIPYMETLIFMYEEDLSDEDVGIAILEYVATEYEKINNMITESGVEFTDEELEEIGFITEAKGTSSGIVDRVKGKILNSKIGKLFKKEAPVETFVGGVKKSVKETPGKIKEYVRKKAGIKTAGEQVKEKLVAKGVDLKAKAIKAGEAAKARGKEGLIRGQELAKKGAAKTQELYGSLKERLAKYQKQRKRKQQIEKVKTLGKKYGKRVGITTAAVGLGALAIKLATAVRSARKWKKEKCGGLSGPEAYACQAKAAKMAIEDLKKFRSQECKNRPNPATCEKATTENINTWTARLRSVESKKRA